MKFTPFLQLVASAYLQYEPQRMSQYCFVFPNKRSGVFFQHYVDIVSRQYGITIEHVTVSTISNLVNELCIASDGDRIELLFILYNAYKSVVLRKNPAAQIEEFDRFRYWGDMLLNDFNDVDKYLVDPYQLFKNVKDFKDLRSNYLTDEQLEIIKNYWGEDKLPNNVSADIVDDDGTSFWQHYVPNEGNRHDDRNVAQHFFRLWEILYDVYTEFGKMLDDSGITYQGMSYRRAANRLKQIKSANLRYGRYVFVGFNVLSASELAIFSRLQAAGLADFYWDFNSPAFHIEGNSANTFLHRQSQQFKSLYELNESEIGRMPEVSIVGVPSNIAQVKEAGRLLSEMVKDGRIENADNAIDTAVVLPDEELFIPMISSVPTSIRAVNITMGFPLRLSAVSSLFGAIVAMQIRSHKNKDGSVDYFHDDVLSVLSHSLLQSYDNAVVTRVGQAMNSERLYNLSSHFIESHFPSLYPIFRPVYNQNNLTEVAQYIDDIFVLLQGIVEANGDVADSRMISSCKDILSRLVIMIQRHKISMTRNTLFHLIEKSIFALSVNFKGEPLNGLQIMGVLETRSLDFKNVIMLSMNERIFPRKHYTKSFIPDALRRGYGLATVEFQESIYAYYFYRLLSRAENVTLYYDARTSGVKNGEMSRYLHQLRFLFPGANITNHIQNYTIAPVERYDIAIPKDSSVMCSLMRYRTPGSGYSFSASAINEYVSCPLQFYLHRVADVRLPDEETEYIDESTYGRIVHRVAEVLYRNAGRKYGIITRQVLDDLISDSDGAVKDQIINTICEYYHYLDKDELTKKGLIGQSGITADMIHYILRGLLAKDMQFAPFHFIEGEWARKHQTLRIDDDNSINFTLSIDRLDRLASGVVRVVDYKTGDEPLVFNQYSDLVNPENEKRPKGIFQVLLYCYAYKQFTGYSGPIAPFIYPMRSICKTDELQPVKYGKVHEIWNFGDCEDEFLSVLRPLIQEIFNPDIPFRRTNNNHACKYCKYADICCDNR